MQFFKNPGKLLARVSAAVLGGYLMLTPGSTAIAQDEESFTLNSLLGEDRIFDIAGWTQIGYHNKADGEFNSHPHRLNLHQQYLYIQKVADGSEGLDFGFRFDAIYGVDGPNTQAFGNPPGSYDFDDSFTHGIYGWALPQLYGEVAVGDLSVKAGHFYTIIGFETVTAPDNFFYSHALTFNFNEPFTHTGVLASYNLSENVTAYGGWTLGWDTGFDKFNDGDDSDGSSWLGGLTVNLTDNITATYANTIGDFGLVGEGYMQSFVLNATFMEDWNYIFHTDYLHLNTTFGDGEPGYDSYSFNQYLIYSINDQLAAGVRGEIWTADDNTLYITTLGVNIKPTSNLIIRPEVRWQFGDKTDERFFSETFNVQSGDTIFGIDAILTY